MKKFLPFSKRQPSLDHFGINRGGFNASERVNGKTSRRISATSLNSRSIQVVRGAYNIDLNKVDSRFTKLHRACLLNDDSQVKKHIYKIDNNSRDSSNRYPIHLACVNGNFNIVKLLVENEANLNVQDNDGNTPLIKSIESGQEHLVKYLLDNGADPNITDLAHNSALHWAFMTESMIAIDALMSSRKCNYTLRNQKDETCLHIAVRCNLIHSFTYQTLIEAGADITSRDQLGLTPLDIAQACDNKRALEAFERCRLINQDSTSMAKNNFDERNNSDQSNNVRKLCEEYKVKYLTKNRENLEYEKKLIHLNGEMERLKLDMSYLKEQNTKLENERDELISKIENLESLNNDLKNSMNKFQENIPDARAKTDTKNLGPEKPEYMCTESMDHESFLTTKNVLQDRINLLRNEVFSNKTK